MQSFRVDRGFLHFASPVFAESAPDGLSRLLHTVPALPDSLLKLVALLEQPRVDLNAVCTVIRADLGLTLRVLSLAPAPLDPTFGALEQCVLEAGIQCLRTLGQTMPALALSHRNPKLHADLLGLWQHSRTVAESAEQIALKDGTADPDKTYLAGLLHDLLELSAMLGGLAGEHGAPPESQIPPENKDLTDVRRLALAWAIPPYAIESIETRGVGAGPVGAIAALVATAHERVQRPAECVATLQIHTRTLAHG
jgi:hypothetical protein